MTTYNLRCVTYTDENSIGGSSYQDLMLGLDHKILGCGTALYAGDTVLLTANRAKTRYVVLVRLDERLEECDLWLEHGGKRWNNNFRFTALTQVQAIDAVFKSSLKDFADKLGLNPNCLLNSRFCSAKMWPLLNELLTSGILRSA